MRPFNPLGRILLIALACCAVGSCARPAPAPVSEAELARARAALVPFKAELLRALISALAEGGPEAAIDVCRVRAPEIAAAASVDGARMGRTAVRLRNRENAPERWVEPLLAEYQAAASDTTSRAVRLEHGRVGYVEPIYVKPLCLTCHGEAVAPGLLATIREVYPDDQATGFRENDLRGVFWVELSAEGS
ncbi:MAG: c-type heme family protein [Candidatus Eiseniibacteriota bacterium]